MSIRAINWAIKALTGSDVKPSTRMVLISLAYHHNHGSGQCFPSLATISQQAGLCERKTRVAIRDLEAMGLIKVARKGRPGANAANRYTLFGQAKGTSQSGPRGPVQTGTKKPVQTGPSNRPTGAADREVYTKGDFPEPTNEGFRLRVVGGRDA